MLRELLHRDRPLGVTALAFLALFIALALIAPFDTQTITGINRWIKPMKFAISIAIFLATVGWFTTELRPHPRARAWIVWTFIVMMLIEIVCIAGQAARGTTSHFNASSAFNGLVFSLMGTAITINTVAAAAMLWLLRRDTPPDRAGYLAGVRLGLAVFVVGSLLGFVLVANGGHSVPAPDGGPGLFFVNWSVERGDLRIAHFIGLHALQALPLLGYALDRSAAAPATRRGIVATAAVVWLAVTAAMLAIALAGRPLIAA